MLRLIVSNILLAFSVELDIYRVHTFNQLFTVPPKSLSSSVTANSDRSSWYKDFWHRCSLRYTCSYQMTSDILVPISLMGFLQSLIIFATLNNWMSPANVTIPLISPSSRSSINVLRSTNPRKAPLIPSFVRKVHSLVFYPLANSVSTWGYPPPHLLHDC